MLANIAVHVTELSKILFVLNNILNTRPLKKYRKRKNQLLNGFQNWCKLNISVNMKIYMQRSNAFDFGVFIVQSSFVF
jgi:hypothetical protein